MNTIIETLTGNTATLSERINAALYVSGVGVAVVFVVLVVLVVLVTILKLIDEKFTKKNVGDVGVADITSSPNSAIDQKVIAVISAAVFAVVASQSSSDMVMPGMGEGDSTWKLEARTINHSNHMPKI